MPTGYFSEIIDAKTKFYLTASSNPGGRCKIDKLFLNTSGETPTSFQEVEFACTGSQDHGNP